MGRIKFKMVYLISILFSFALIAVDFLLLFESPWFFPIIILALLLGGLHFWFDFFREVQRQKNLELRFLDFMRNLVESVKSGVSIPKSIVHSAQKDYVELNPYVQKLAHQIEWGIPTTKALITFAVDTENKIVKRSISIITEAEKSGGNIADILSSVVASVMNTKKMREERRASVYSQVVQGYVIFYVFIVIMLVLQLWLFPKLTETDLGTTLQGGFGGLGFNVGASGGVDLDPIFFSLVLLQGFFAGLMIGKFSEGNIKIGLLHSLILVVSAALIITTARGLVL